MIQVKLPEEDLQWARGIARKRRSESIRLGLKDCQHYSGQSHALGPEIETCMAELSVARGLGLPWPATVNHFQGPDLPPDIEIRHTPVPMGRLIFRPEDDKDGTLRRFILVTGQDGVYVVVGWDYSYNIALPEFLDNPNSMGQDLYNVMLNYD